MIGTEELGIGFGGAPIGNLYRKVDYADAQDTVKSAWNHGIRYYDTAPQYGYGLSERRLGDALRQYPRDEYIISSKVGRLLSPKRPSTIKEAHFAHSLPFEARFDYSYDGVIRSFEDSLQRLGLDRIDILLIHDIGAMAHGANNHEGIFREAINGGYSALHELREQGVIKAIGLGVNEWEVCLKAMDYGSFDCFMLARCYTLLNQDAIESFLPHCEKEGVSIIQAGPYCSGILASGPKAGATYNYTAADPSIMDRVREIERICEDHNTPLAAAALQFPLAHPSVACVLPGMRSPEEVDLNVKLLQIKIPSSLWDDLKAADLIHPLAPIPSNVETQSNPKNEGFSDHVSTKS